MRPLPARLRQSNRQRGAVSLAIAALIMFILAAAVTAVMSISGSSTNDSAANEQQITALFLAESGLERGQKIIASANPITNAVCTGIGGGPYSLGRGTFTLSATSTPASCDNSGVTPCTSCALQSVGTVGSASRKIARTISLTEVNGTACNASTQSCTTPTMSLKNNYANTAIALFNLAHRRQGNQTAAICTLAQCALEWNIYAQNGASSVGDMGNSVTIGSGLTYTITETLSSSRNYAEVGALFPGSSTPSIVGAYWDDTNPSGGGTKTVGKTADSAGQTNNGTATSSGTCTTPTTDSKQACTSWCYGGDTLVFGVGAHAAALTDQLSSVTFNTAGTPAQNIALTRIAKYPNSSIPGAPTDVYSEVWYARNPNLSPTPVAANASSYKGNGTGAIGATFTGSVSGTTLTVTSAPNYPLRIISPGVAGTGDTLSSSGGGTNVTGNPTITSQLSSTETGGALGGRGTYQISGSSQTVTSRSMSASSKILHVTACTICFFAPTDAVSGTAFTISSQPSGTTGGVGNYLLSGTPANGTTAASAAVLAGTAGTTIYLPASPTPSMPTVTTPQTKIAVSSGTGRFAANTMVTAVTSPDPNAATKSFTVSTTPTTALNLATICGGTCAFFDNPSSTTTFTIAKSAGTDYWAAGFMCLSGADITPSPVTSTTVRASTWSEVVQ